MPIVREFLSNYALICAGSAWFLAQILKVFTGIFKVRKFNVIELLFGTGGMPSSHSAAVCSLATACALCYGIRSGEFAIALILCIIVIRDATGVRREAGKHAQLLNRLVSDLLASTDQEEVNEKLKELLGHTPLQVFVGCIVGILVPFLVALIPHYSAYWPL